MNNKLIKFIILFLEIFYSYSVNAFSKTDKTFLSTRSQIFNLPIELSLFSDEKYSIKTPKHRSILEIAPFYSTSFNDLSPYFLYGNKRSLKIAQDISDDVDNRYLKFDETSTNNLSGILKVKPKTKNFGFFISYFIKLDDFLEKANFEILTYVCRTSFDPQLKIKNSKSSSTRNKTIQDYFKGEVMFSAPEGLQGTTEGTMRALQDPLVYGKINEEVNNSGLADILLKFSYDTISEYYFIFRVTGILLIPTNNGSNSLYLFEPRIGNGNHWGLGFELSGRKNVFEKENDTLDFIFDARFIYLFNAYETRILGLNNIQGRHLNWSEYILLGEAQFPKVVPAANALTQNVKVIPGAAFEGAAMFSYKYKDFVINGGYDIWLRQKEKIKITDKWDNEKYGLVGSNYSEDIIEFTNDDNVIRNLSNFQLDNTNLTDTIKRMNLSGQIPSEQGFIQRSQLNKKVAQTPGLFSNTFFIALGYKKENNNNIITFGLGLSSELAFNNNSPSQNNIWFKAAISF